MKTLTLVIAAIGFPALASAADINFIKPSDLPSTTLRYFETRGRGTPPEFAPGYGIDEAMRSSSAEERCESKVGKRLTDWKMETSRESFYWSYKISAGFECLPPTLSIDLDAKSADQLITDLKISENKADLEVLCYESFDEVCNGTVLSGYHERQTCEIQDVNGGPTATLVDISDDGKILQSQGAVKLSAELPIYLDGRRDDTPGPNCGGHLYGKLKGLSRRAATVHCRRPPDGGAAQCRVEGIVRLPANK